MKLSREQATQNRKRIVDVASRLFRARGIHDVAVTDLMKSAGFTHGGFYNHFPSKDALTVDACDAAFEQSVERLTAGLVDDPGESAAALAGYIDRYLSPAHRDNPADSCPTASLASDAARHGAHVQTAFADGVEGMLAALSAHQSIATRAAAVRLLAEIVGALTLARAVVGANPALSDEILDTSRDGLRPTARTSRSTRCSISSRICFTIAGG